MSKEPQKMNLESMDIADEKREQLKQLFPEAFVEDKIDFDQLKRALGQWVEPSKERFGLNWPGKAECMKVIQQPSVATLKPVRDESVDFDNTENIFIEGDNLEVLKLLQKSYFGKVKMIYIDPPYNTGKEFIYPDKFSETLDTYLQYTGQIDENGKKFTTNTDTQGRYHSNWLNMMYPRLYLARNLLREDGVIFISIDDHEQSNLKALCDYIFGEENFISQLIWKSRQNVDSRSLNGASNDHEYVLCYSRDVGTRIRGKEIDKGKYSNSDNDPRGPWMSSPMDGIATKDKRPNLHYTIVNSDTKLEYNPSPENGWRFQRSTVQKLIDDDRIIWPKNPNSKPRFKRYLNELQNTFTGFSSILDVDFTAQGTKELRDLMEMETVKFPKPTSFIKTLSEQGIKDKNDEIILDFFAGSGTTAHAVMQLNAEDGGSRKCISVQLPEKTDTDSDASKADFKTIADISKERIRRAGKKIKKEIENKDDGLFAGDDKPNLDLGFKVFRLDKSNFKIWPKMSQGDAENIDNFTKQLEMHVDHVSKASTPEDILYELLIKAGFELTVKIEKLTVAGKEVFSVKDNALLICLDKNLNEELFDEMVKLDPLQVICLDQGFNKNDQLKANAVQTFKCRAASEETAIVFKTV